MVNNHMIHMTAGTGEDSYACNSLIQAVSISKVFPMIQEALKELYSTELPKCVMIADLGCASGPNALMLLPEVLDITYDIYRAKNCGVPEIHMFLNDLPANDFNTICLSLPNFYENLEKERKGDLGPCFISATPGSYYNRLFPKTSMHFVQCSNSVHWLLQIPKKLFDENGESINKGNIFITDSSPLEVIMAYQEQFQEEFTLFLKARAQEIVKGGRMVLNLIESTKFHKPQDFFMTKALNNSLKDMVKEGLIDGKKMDNFEIPIYPPTTEEIQSLIEKQGSFYIEQHKHFTLDWGAIATDHMAVDDYQKSNGNINFNELDLHSRAKFVVGVVKSSSTHLMTSQFGNTILQDLYSRVTDVIAETLKNGNVETLHQAICLVKN